MNQIIKILKNILHIISSPRADESISLKLGNAIVARLRDTHFDAEVKEVNLSENPFPHLNTSLVQAIAGLSEDAEQQALLLERSDKAVKDLLEADTVVISLPFLNFGVPSVLKSWLDHIIRAGLTFSYGANGPIGLVTGKKVYLAMASGGVYSEGPMQAYDHAIPYLTDVLSFLGLTDISVIRAEGTKVPGLKEIALEKAIAAIEI